MAYGLGVGAVPYTMLGELFTPQVVSVYFTTEGSIFLVSLFVHTKDKMFLTKNLQLRALGSCTAQVGLSCKNSSNYSNVSLLDSQFSAVFFLLVLLKKAQ